MIVDSQEGTKIVQRDLFVPLPQPFLMVMSYTTSILSKPKLLYYQNQNLHWHSTMN